MVTAFSDSMRSNVLTSVIALASILSATGFAQGTINFANLVPNPAGTGLDAPATYGEGTGISGSVITAELLAGTNPTSLVSVARAGFLTNAPGYFNGGIVTLTNIAPGGTGFFQVRLWETSYGSFAAVQAANTGVWAQSSIFQSVTGGAGTPPSPPTPLTGLVPIQLWAYPLVPIPILYTSRTTYADIMLIFQPRTGQTYLIEQSLDLANWTTNATVSGICSCEPAFIRVPASNARAFFRVHVE